MSIIGNYLGDELGICFRNGVFENAIRYGIERSAEIDRQQAERREFQHEHNALIQQINGYEYSIQQMNKDYQKFKDRINALEIFLKCKKDDIKERNETISTLNSTISSLREKIDAYVAQSSQKDLYINNLESKISELSTDKEEVLAQVRNASAISMTRQNEMMVSQTEAFYMQASMVADGAVKNFLRHIIKTGATIDNLEAHESNVFAMAFEAYVKEYGEHSNSEWREELSLALNARDDG